MAEQPIPEVQAIPIDSAGRYVVALSVGRLLKQWWSGEEKFLVMSLVPGASVRFERIGE